MEVVASLSQGRTAAAQCGLFTYKSIPVIFEPPCYYLYMLNIFMQQNSNDRNSHFLDKGNHKVAHILAKKLTRTVDIRV